MNKQKYNFKATDDFPLYISVILLAIILVTFLHAIITGAYTNYYGMLILEIVLFVILIFFIRELIKPPLILGRDYIAYPKITLFLRKRHKKIQFRGIKEIRLILSNPSKISSDKLLGHLFSLDLHKYKKFLKEGPIDSELEKTFEKNSNDLGEDTKLSKEDGTWYVKEDGTKKYIIEIGDRELNVYFLDNVYRIFIYDKTGKKYNLSNLGKNEKKFAKELKKRMTKEQWESKVVIK